MTRCLVCGASFPWLPRMTYGVPMCSYACEDSDRGQRVAAAFGQYIDNVAALRRTWRDLDAGVIA